MSPVTPGPCTRVPRPRYKAKHRPLSRGGRVSKYHGHIFHPRLVFISATRSNASLSLFARLLIIRIRRRIHRTSISSQIFVIIIGEKKLEKEMERLNCSCPGRVSPAEIQRILSSVSRDWRDLPRKAIGDRLPRNYREVRKRAKFTIATFSSAL